MTAWRVISSRRHYGHWEFLFDDLVIEPNLARYIIVACDRNAERITLHRLGTVREVMEKGTWSPMRGTTSLNPERKNPPIENYDLKGGGRESGSVEHTYNPCQECMNLRRANPYRDESVLAKIHVEAMRGGRESAARKEAKA